MGWAAWALIGLLLRNENEGIVIQKPYYLLYVPIVVASIQFLKSNPAEGTVAIDSNLVGDFAYFYNASMKYPGNPVP